MAIVSTVLGQTRKRLLPAAISGFEKFVLLQHWSFVSGEGGDFESHMKGLDVGLLASDADPDVADRSYMVSDIIDRDGESNTCLYRSPFISVQENYSQKAAPAATTGKVATEYPRSIARAQSSESL